MSDMSIISGSTMSAVSKICYTAAGLLLGRKVFWAISYKTGGFLVNLMGKENVAEWNQTSQDYWARAKEDAFQDLTATTAFITMGLVSGSVGTALLKEEQKKEEPGYIQNYAMPILKGLYNHKGKITGMGLLAGIGYQCNRGISPEQKRIVREFVQTIKKPIEESTERAMQFVFGNKFPGSATSTESSPWSPESMANKFNENSWKQIAHSINTHDFESGKGENPYPSLTTATSHPASTNPWSSESMADKFMEEFWENF